MSKMPWIRFFPSDWLAGTRGLSAAETGIYITLISLMYENGEPLRDDPARLARLCGASNSTFVKAIGALISEGKIQRTDAGLWNDRVSRELETLSQKSDVAREAAKSRWDKNPKKTKGEICERMPDAYADDMPRERMSEARSQKPEEDNNQQQLCDSAAAAEQKALEVPAELERRCVQATGWTDTTGFSAITALVAEGEDFDGRILPMLRTLAAEFKSSGKAPPKVWAYATKAIRDPTRKPMAEGKPVEMVWITEGSKGWNSLVASGKRESLLRMMLRTDGGGKEGLWWAVSQLPSAQLVKQGEAT